MILFGNYIMRLLLALIIFVISTLRADADTHIELRQSFEGGFHGWTVADSKNYRGTWMNNLVVLVTPEKKKLYFASSRPFIEKWGLTDSNANIVIRSRGAHGPSLIEQFNIKTGDRIQDSQGSLRLKDTPDWAKPWCDETDAEQGS